MVFTVTLPKVGTSAAKKLGKVNFEISGLSHEAVNEAVRLIGGEVRAGTCRHTNRGCETSVSGAAAIREPPLPCSHETKAEQKSEPAKSAGERTIVAPDGQRIEVLEGSTVPWRKEWCWRWKTDNSTFLGPVDSRLCLVPMPRVPTDAEVLADYWKWSVQKALDEGKKEAEKIAPKEPTWGTAVDRETLHGDIEKLSGRMKKIAETAAAIADAVPTAGERDICAPDGTRIVVAKIRSVNGSHLGWTWSWMTNPSPCTYTSGASMPRDVEPTNEQILAHYEDWKLRKEKAIRGAISGCYAPSAFAFGEFMRSMFSCTNKNRRSHFDPWRNKWVTE